MKRIELTEQEVQSILNTLNEIPLKYSLGLHSFFVSKLNEKETKKTKQEKE